MKKKYLLLICLVTCILLSGCTVDYEIEIKEDLSVIENISVVVPTQEVEKYTTYQTYSEFLTGIYENTNYSTQNNVKFKELNQTGYIGGNIVASYDSIEKYIKESEALHELYIDTTVNTQDNKIYIDLNNIIPLESKTSTRNPIDEINLIIKSPYEIKGLKNANCSIKNNRFECKIKITKEDEKENMNFYLDKSINTTKSVFIYIISGIIVLGLISLVLYYKYKNANNI